MNIIIIIILAIVQGATEFLPISSSGHLVLLYKWFGIENNTILLSVILHLATLISVIIFYRKELKKLILKPFCKTNICIILTTLVTCIIALIFKKTIESTFDGRFLSLGFIITAVMLFISQMISNKSTPSVDITNIHISYSKSIIIGLMQGVACFPAISRSGTTIATGLVCGISKSDTTKYSFIISIPIILASTVLETYEYFLNPTSMPFSRIELLIGFVVACIIGILSIKLMTNFVKKQKLYYFSFYLLVLALIIPFTM